ncbi:hypothetical protein POL68_36280 [Stigmatella sp. ncwal1]|uniref:Uncharacterized protein n=1 Tax=Stigmatella ashevillensis TaxID=2995309 RepID=A0ABT5DJZ4_9BACT|nr:hypothetical protein [Stigmatella ashevillena]MDC0713980.1 hypothetical protein [Stigmatella ashevillena]
MSGRLDFELGFGRSAKRPILAPATMRLLLRGDSAIDWCRNGRCWPSERRNNATSDIYFEQFDDFHPDRLYAHLTLFQALSETRTGPSMPQNGLLNQRLGQAAASAVVVAPTLAGGVDALVHSIFEPHSVTRDDEPELQACAEFHLDEPAAQAMHEADMTPLLSHRNAATVLRLQSVARPARALSGLTGSGAGGALA